MVKPNTLYVAMMAGATPPAEGRNCNTGFDYCGKTLLAIGNYRAQIDAAIAAAGIKRFPGDGYTTDSLFKCLGGSNGDIKTFESPSLDLELVLARLGTLDAKVEELRSIGGNAGLSIGVAHKGTSIFEKHFGFRDVASATPPDSHTVQHIGSLTKAFVGAAIAALVDDGKLSWEAPLGESGVVPLFSASNTDTENKALPQVNLVDLLAHRLCVAMKESYYHMMSTTLLSEKANTAHIVSKLPPVADFRSRMMYNNWGYALAGEIIEQISGQDLGEFMDQRFFQPLGLKNTTLGKPSSENYAASYMLLSDGTPFQVDHPPLNSGAVLAAAGGMKSTMSDMLVLYSAFLQAFQDQSMSGATSSPSSPFRQAASLFADHSSINPGSTYGLGWCLTELPDQAGLVGVNVRESPDGMPVIGKETKPQRLFYHNGSIAKKTVANALSHHPEMNAQLARERTHGTTPKPLSNYVGYYNSAEGNDYGFQVTVIGDKLRVNLQGLAEVFYDLEHYEHDVFVFYGDRDAETKKVVNPKAAITMRKFFFEVDERGEVARARWGHDFSWPIGELFEKGPARNTVKI